MYILNLSISVGTEVRQVKAWVGRQTRPPAENAKIFFNDAEGSK